MCPLTLQKMATTLHDLGPLADRIAPLFIAIDPVRDTTEGDMTGMMWGMGLVWLIVIIVLVLVLVLAIAALVKYVFFRSKIDRLSSIVLETE